MEWKSLGTGRLNSDMYPGYEYIRDDNSLFILYRNQNHRDIGILVTPERIEVSGSTLSGLLLAVHHEGINKIIVDMLKLSSESPEIGKSYAIRISQYAPKADISKVVIIGLAEADERYDTASTSEEAVDKLLQ